MLSQTQLNKLETLWVSRGAQIASGLAPGLGPGVAQEMVAPHGFALPAELELLFGWHDGAPLPGRTHQWHEIGNDISFCGLAGSIETHEESGELWEDASPYPLLPLFGMKDQLLIECSPESPEVGAIWIMEWAEEPRQILPSLGHLVDVFIELIEVGAWTYASSGYPESATVDELRPEWIVELGFV